jgi:hypothetical protein
VVFYKKESFDLYFNEGDVCMKKSLEIVRIFVISVFVAFALFMGVKKLNFEKAIQKEDVNESQQETQEQSCNTSVNNVSEDNPFYKDSLYVDTVVIDGVSYTFVVDENGNAVQVDENGNAVRGSYTYKLEVKECR